MSKEKKEKTEEDYSPDLDMYGSMAYYLAEKLHISPNEILDTWSVPQLIVSYGYYANEDAQKNFNEWKNLDSKQRGKIGRPKEQVVYFMGVL